MLFIGIVTLFNIKSSEYISCAYGTSKRLLELSIFTTFVAKQCFLDGEPNRDTKPENNNNTQKRIIGKNFIRSWISKEN